MQSTRVALLVALILAGQLTLVIGSSPYYSLYYNTLMFFGKPPQDLFQLPEPAYGLDLASLFIRSHAVDPRIVMTNIAPHLVHDYLTDYLVIADRGIGWTGNDTYDFSTVLSLQVSYLIIGTRPTQLYPNTPLVQLAKSHADLVLTAVAAGTPVVYLYFIHRPEVHNVVWAPSATANWTIRTNNGTSLRNDYAAGVALPIEFSTGYPPSRWVKASLQFSSVNATSLRLTSMISYVDVSDVTCTVTLLDSRGNSVEVKLIPPSLGFVSSWRPDIPLALLNTNTSIDLSTLSTIQFTIYNSGGPASGRVVVTELELVN